jgi:hypothetical protein
LRTTPYPAFSSVSAKEASMALSDGSKVLAWAAIRTFARLNQSDLKVTASRAEQLINNVIESQYDLVETSKEIKSWLKIN